MKLLAISVGQPQKYIWQNKEIWTSITKTPVSGSVFVGKENINGDRQADLNVHGGVDKAVYAYSFDTYDWWKKELGLETLNYGSLGENLTIDQFNEKEIFVGDIFSIGSCELEAVQPRQPCFKLAVKFGNQKIVKVFNDYDRSGIYFRVKKEGTIQAGDSLILIKSENIKVSISELFHFVKDKNSISKNRALEISQVSSLNEKWREKFLKIAQAN